MCRDKVQINQIDLFWKDRRCIARGELYCIIVKLLNYNSQKRVTCIELSQIGLCDVHPVLVVASWISLESIQTEVRQIDVLGIAGDCKVG